jgi:hypothetical protein
MRLIPSTASKFFINQDGASATRIKRVLADSKAPFVRFYIMIADTDSRMVLSPPNYTIDDAETTIAIDIKALVSDKKNTVYNTGHRRYYFHV